MIFFYKSRKPYETLWLGLSIFSLHFQLRIIILMGFCFRGNTIVMKNFHYQCYQHRCCCTSKIFLLYFVENNWRHVFYFFLENTISKIYSFFFNCLKILFLFIILHCLINFIKYFKQNFIPGESVMEYQHPGN